MSFLPGHHSTGHLEATELEPDSGIWRNYFCGGRLGVDLYAQKGGQGDTQATAWEAGEAPDRGVPCTEFVVLRTPEGSCEVVLERALHPLDREAAKRVVASSTGDDFRA